MSKTNLIEGHVAVLPGEEFDPTQGRIGVFFNQTDLEETLGSRNITKGIAIKKIEVPANAILRANAKRFAYKPDPEARLLSWPKALMT